MDGRMFGRVVAESVFDSDERYISHTGRCIAWNFLFFVKCGYYMIWFLKSNLFLSFFHSNVGLRSYSAERDRAYTDISIIILP